MAKRKTVTVESLKQKANGMLCNTPDHDSERRMGICALIESVLFETDNYRGYNFLPGVMDFTVDPPKLGDDTRRFYY